MSNTTQTPPATEPAMIDTAEVARMLSCSKKHVARLAKDGAMPAATKLGGLIRWNRKVILDWIEGGCRPIFSAAG